MIKILENGFNELGLNYNESKNEKFELYKNLIKEWNEKINITSIDKDEEIYIKHFLDSLLILNKDNENECKKIIDVGTGGGFPGIPLKIANENLEVTLLDSLRKRMDFLNIVKEKLNLKNVDIIHGRAEDYGRNDAYREQYDICVSRAVAYLNVLSEYCLPFVKVGGFFVAYKSESITQEIEDSSKAIAKLGGKIQSIKEIKLPNTDIIRKIVVIEKVEKMNKIYPRKAGKPTKEPLI